MSTPFPVFLLLIFRSGTENTTYPCTSSLIFIRTAGVPGIWCPRWTRSDDRQYHQMMSTCLVHLVITCQVSCICLLQLSVFFHSLMLLS